VRPDTPEQIAERIAYRKACEQARLERQQAFPSSLRKILRRRMLFKIAELQN